MIWFDNTELTVSFQAYFVATAKVKDVVVAPNVNSVTFDSPQSVVT